MNRLQHWYGHGKLLLTGEYLVMEGAQSFALPLNQGQSLQVQENPSRSEINWKATHCDGNWFHAVLDIDNFKVKSTDNVKLAASLSQILLATRSLSKNFLRSGMGCQVETKLDFKPEFGFGSSSTFISNLAWWADIDPYALLRMTFGGSGYDIACARANSPIFFQITDTVPTVEAVDFKPSFSDHIYFVYLGKKQKSTESIDSFKKTAVFKKTDLDAISHISRQIIKTNTLEDFEHLLIEHERIMSNVLGRPTIKSQQFSTYPGTVKSLGGWGGDFVMITSKLGEIDFRTEMKKRNFPVVFRFNELVL